MTTGKIPFMIFAVVLLSGFAQFVSAATIEGKLYDYSLFQVRQGIVEVDTVPAQRHVSVNGSYSFNVQKGNYTIRAASLREGIVLANATQTIAVEEQGIFNLDLILLPALDPPSTDEEIDVSDVEHALASAKIDRYMYWPPGPWTVVLIVFVAVSSIALLRMSKRRMAVEDLSKTVELTRHSIDPSSQAAPHKDLSTPQKDSSSSDARHDLAALVRALKARDGRATQKELRKDLPFSEAKVSLMVSELEHEGVVTKIRKGRGNIIILKYR
ncbi:MAG: hypothetical protein AABX47_00300 [Nanoarchaeota archaeon]